MKTLLKLTLVFFLFASGFANADYAEDKDVCYTYSSNLGLFAEMRDEHMPRDTLIEKILVIADNEGWSDEGTVLILYMVRYVYANPDIKPTEMKETAYKSCMKKRGHVKA